MVGLIIGRDDGGTVSNISEWSWFCIELIIRFTLFAMQLDYCNIQRVFEQK
jgi:hypothetical protein